MGLPEANSAATAPGARPAFVGRAAELAELQRALGDALGGRGRLYLLCGEPGIGKTRLCDELSDSATKLGAFVAWGRSWEAGGAPAYFPWLEVFVGLADRLDDATLVRALGDGAAALRDLVPGLRARLPLAAAVMASSAEESRFRLAHAVAQLLRSAARPSGLLVVLEDLHAADEPSLWLLAVLARELHGSRALVVGTFRDVEARLTPEIGEALARVTRDATTLALARLDQRDTEQLVGARLGARPHELREEIFRRTQGNPLFIEEMLRLVRAQGDAAQVASALPIGMREVIQRRLERVTPNVRALLEAGAVSGDEIEPELVAEALGEAAEALRAGLSEAARAGVLVSSDALFRFSHALFREVLTADLGAERRRQLHGLLARALIQRSRFSDPVPYERIAHHLLGGSSDSVELAVHYAERATQRALSVFAFEAAVQLLERARGAVLSCGAAPRLLGKVLALLGRAQMLGGDRARGREACLEATAIARESADAELLAEAALAYGLEITAALVNPVLVQLLEEALDALPPEDSKLRVSVTARLAAAMQPCADLLHPIGLARQSIESARRLGDPETLLGALYTGMAAMMDIVDPRERLPLNLEVEQLAQAAGDTERLLRTQARLVFDHMELADVASADARIESFTRLAEQARAGRYLWRAPLFRSMRAMMEGRFSDCERLLREAQRLGEQAKDPQLERTLVFHREGLERAWERHDQLIRGEPNCRRMRLDLYSGPHWQNGGSAFTYSRLEELDKVKMYLGLIPDGDWPIVSNPPAFAHLGEPIALCGSDAAARRVYDLLWPARERSISWGWTKMLWDGPASRVLGLLAQRLGRQEQAAEHFEAALATLNAIGAAPYLARTRYEYGRALLSRPGELERQRARQLLEQAAEDANRLGLSGLLRLIRAPLALASASPASTRAAPEPAPVSSQRVSSPSVTPALTEAASAEAPPFTLLLEGEYWALSHGKERFRLKDSLGLRYLARLLAEPGRPLHVLELSSSGAERGEAIDTGDFGELLDERARDEYRGRVQELRAALDEAEQHSDLARATRLREELEFVAAELARGVGLAGRARRGGSATERARSAVQRRLRNALERIEQQSPALGEYLHLTLKTGIYCVFMPLAAPRH
ncbi:MAG: AAA family ATPase [Deltaproteobacteria bacterium]